ncbi:estradiol 17-beta-dehydrogenase 2-like [Pomacea canaliculata]|uniref:estradiol 17-beta-dehydrogenase 2-like n=1 Tax=Pomacea canaliculata TaxID=400727 RepID=UPI000D7264B2|nr:estradiol 17-beta-dehydrogenase 2-like [Pomacea canaliculata]XP_025100771.1 estradiol 17-beta-dehydrogenase 2-like [Pomacea canaliculata]
MELWPAAAVVGAYVGVITLGLSCGSVRLSSQMLLSILKLSALAFLASATCCTPVALTLTLVVAYCLYHSLPSPRLSPQGRAVFITGCDTGLGHMLAKKLDAMGMHVFAGCLYPGGEGATTLTSECSDRLKVITVDVCNPTVVREAAERIKQELHGKELWGVVNNAGMLYIGCLELLTEDDIRRLVDVNFMGQVHVVRAFLPLLRAKPWSAGQRRKQLWSVPHSICSHLQCIESCSGLSH